MTITQNENYSELAEKLTRSNPTSLVAAICSVAIVCLPVIIDALWGADSPVGPKKTFADLKSQVDGIDNEVTADFLLASFRVPEETIGLTTDLTQKKSQLTELLVKQYLTLSEYPRARDTWLTEQHQRNAELLSEHAALAV